MATIGFISSIEMESALFDYLRAFLMREPKECRAAFGRSGDIAAVASEPVEIRRDLQPLRRFVKADEWLCVSPQPSNHAHHIAAGSSHFLKDHLVGEGPEGGPLRVLPDNDGVRVEDAGADDCLIHLIMILLRLMIYLSSDEIIHYSLSRHSARCFKACRQKYPTI